MAAPAANKTAKLSNATLVFTDTDRLVLETMVEPRFAYNKDFIEKLILQKSTALLSHSFLVELHRAIKAVASATAANVGEAFEKVRAVVGASDFQLEGQISNPAGFRTFAKNYEKVVRISKIRLYQSHSNAAYARVHDMMATILHRLSKFFVNSVDQNGETTPIYAIKFDMQEAARFTEADGKITCDFAVTKLEPAFELTRKQLATLHRYLKVASDFRTKAANVTNKSAVLRAVNSTRTNTIRIPMALRDLLAALGLTEKYTVGDRVQETVLNTAMKTKIRTLAQRTNGVLDLSTVPELAALLGSRPDKEFVIKPVPVDPAAFFVNKVYAAPKVKDGNSHIIRYRDSAFEQQTLDLNVQGQSSVYDNLTNICKYSRLPNALKKLKYPQLTPNVIQALCDEIPQHVIEILTGRSAQSPNFNLLRTAVIAKLTAKASVAVTEKQITSELKKIAVKSVTVFNVNGKQYFVPEAISGLLSLYNLDPESTPEGDESLQMRRAAHDRVVNASLL